MAWNDIDKIDNKPTEKQIQYAEVLLEAIYGDIIKPVRDMTKQEVSKLISELLLEAEDKNIDYKKFFPNQPDKEYKKPRWYRGRRLF
jgi:hypothetical protein